MTEQLAKAGEEKLAGVTAEEQDEKKGQGDRESSPTEDSSKLKAEDIPKVSEPEKEKEKEERAATPREVEVSSEPTPPPPEAESGDKQGEKEEPTTPSSSPATAAIPPPPAAATSETKEGDSGRESAGSQERTSSSSGVASPEGDNKTEAPITSDTEVGEKSGTDLSTSEEKTGEGERSDVKEVTTAAQEEVQPVEPEKPVEPETKAMEAEKEAVKPPAETTEVKDQPEVKVEATEKAKEEFKVPRVSPKPTPKPRATDTVTTEEQG